jgi:hypothetical protein
MEYGPDEYGLLTGFQARPHSFVGEELSLDFSSAVNVTSLGETEGNL